MKYKYNDPISQTSKSLTKWWSRRNQYTARPRRILKDGSIEVKAIRLGLMVFLLTLAFLPLALVHSIAPQVWKALPDWIGASILSYIGVILFCFLLFPPKRIVLFENKLKCVFIYHKISFFKGKKQMLFDADEINGVKTVEPEDEGPANRTKLYLETNQGDVYLVSLGKWYVNSLLPSEIRQLLNQWSPQTPKSATA
jgi:hypothetical protein